MIVRLMKLKDFDITYPLLKSWIDELGITVKKENAKKHMERLLERGPTLIVTDNGVPVGLFSCIIAKPDWCDDYTMYEELVYIDKEYRGKKLFPWMLEEMEQLARTFNCKELALSPTTIGSRDPEKVKDILINHGYSLYGYRLKKEV